MVQNKKLGAGLALVAGLTGLAVSGTASALPEMIVGSHIASAAQSPVQGTDPVPVTEDTEDEAGVTDDGTDGGAG